MKLELNSISCGYNGYPTIRGFSMAVEPGEVICLLGPNGSGKTTLFKGILGLLPLYAGNILINGVDISKWPRPKLAQKIGYIPQEHNPPFPYKVLDLVIMGRAAYLGSFSSPSKKDVKKAEEALEILNITHLKNEPYTKISGGERQLVLIARALTQQPQILIMDEPTSNLDYKNQVLVLKHIQKLSQLGLSVIMSSHFPNQALFCASKVMLLKNGCMFGVGKPRDMITEENMKKLYDIDVQIVTASLYDGRKVRVCIPTGLQESMPQCKYQGEIRAGYAAI